MARISEKKLTEFEELSAHLLVNLNEIVFFSELSKYLKEEVKADFCSVHLVAEDGLVKQLINRSHIVKNSKSIDSEGVVGHVSRTKRPYFTNDTSRDPLFENSDKEVLKEMCVPISSEGIVIATIRFSIIDEDETRVFSRSSMTKILTVLNNIKRPIENIKMYLEAKNLNELLLKKIEATEKELELSKSGITNDEMLKVEEKDIIFNSEQMKSLLALSSKLSRNDINYIIQGERGVGKEMIGKRIHCRSSRKDNPMLSIDCSSLGDDDLLREIFGERRIGVQKGVEIKKGLLEVASNGTLLLKNIANCSYRAQTAIFSYVANGTARRINDEVPYSSNVRIVATTDRDLSNEVENGSFREDLYYELNKMSLVVPPLRDRAEDIEYLSNYFLNNGRPICDQKSLSPGTINVLKDYLWPGNIRELQSVIERAYILADGMIIEKTHLAQNIVQSQNDNALDEDLEEFIFAEMTLESLEQKHICKTLDFLGGNKTKTAKSLGITVKTLYNKLHNYGMIDQKEA